MRRTLRRVQFGRGQFVGLLLGVGLAFGGAAAAAEPGKPAAAGAAAIEGFREAHFGMTEAQVRPVLRKDFPRSRVAAVVNPSEKTTVLSLTASDLLPDTGPARVSYIFGYRSKQLIQVNIDWQSDGRSAASDDEVVATANQLRDYFASQNLKPDSIVENRKLRDGAILVFRAGDAAGHMVLLVLNGEPSAARRKKPGPPLSLELSYIADPAHPDIFRIRKGAF
jgi:hypothetical protein